MAGPASQRSSTRCVAILFTTLAFGCAKESRFVAVEPNGDADLRVVIAIPSDGEKKVTTLLRDEPFTFALGDGFASDGASFRVYVYAFTLAQLSAEFPGLADKTAVDVKALLSPVVREPGEGAYAPPAPLRVLTAVIDPNSSGDVTYQEVPLSSVKDDPSARLAFELPAAIACAPGERTFRVFNRVEPARVCLFSRTAGCGWTPAGDACADLDVIFERTFEGDASLRELPPKTLATDDGALACTGTNEVARGESRTWLCPGASGATFVAIQDTPKARSGEPWAPTLDTRPSLATNALLAHAPRGALYAADGGSSIALARMEVKDSLQIDRLVREIGTMAEIISIPSSVIGRLRRVTANAVIETDEDQVVVDGDAGTVVLRGDHGVSATSNPLAFYHPPVAIATDVLPLARRRGDVVSGPLDNVYALIDTGVMVLRATVDQVTKVGETPNGQVTFAAGSALSFAAVKKNAEERAIAWSDDGHVFVFDGSGAAVVTDCQLDGRILTVIDGPRVVRRPAGERFVLDLVDLAPVEGGAGCTEERLVTRYLVPASNQDATGELQVDATGYALGAGRETLLYRYDQWVGVLDLGSGLSTAVEVPSAPTRAVLFEDFARTELHVVAGTDDDPRFQSITVPPLGEGVR